MTKIKICGLTREEDIAAVNVARPDWCGFILNYPPSRRNITPDRLRQLVQGLSPEIVPVGVFVDRPMEEIAALLREGVIQVAQLHGRETAEEIAQLRSLAPGCTIWKAFRIRNEEDLRAAEASPADLVLLDNGTGTGQAFDWSLIGKFSRPYLLAGGLDPENLPRAIAALAPYGVDLSSGVETDGRKDPAKIQAAAAAADGRRRIP